MSHTYTRLWASVLTFFSTLNAVQTVLEGRKATEDILHSKDDRLLVVVG